MTSLELAKKAAHLLDEKKGERVNVIEIQEISSLADYFVLATGTSNTHVRALADERGNVFLKYIEPGSGPAPHRGLPFQLLGLAGLGERGGPRVHPGGQRVLRPGPPVGGREDDRLAAGGRGVSFPVFSRFRILPCEENEI